MKKYILPFIILLSAFPAWGQEPLTLNDVESLYFENSPLVKTRKAELKVFDGRLRDAGQRPNPTLNASVESLENGSRETERSVSLSQELDWNGRRRDLVRSVGHRKTAQAHSLDFELRRELARVKTLFCRAVLLQKDIAALGEVMQAVWEFEKANQTRLREGDIAEVDVMRLDAEKRKVLRMIDSLKTEASLERKNLSIALGLATPSLLLTLDTELPKLSSDTAGLLTAARENRSDLKASREIVQGTEAAIRAARKEARYPVTLEAGYKGRTGGFNGFVLGMSVPLPWSHRNQGKVQELDAERSAELLRIEAIDREMVGTLDIALEKLAFLEDRHVLLSKQLEETSNILEIAEFSYGEGESGLLEVLDVVRSQSDIILERNRTTFDIWSVLFDIEALTGSSFTTNGGLK